MGLSGTWVAPENDAFLYTSTVTFSAKPTVTPATLSISSVAFSVKWKFTGVPACSATKAGSGGVWSCTADLWKLGAPLGDLTLAFDVTDSAGDVAEAPAGTRTVVFVAPPAAPTGASETWTGSAVRFTWRSSPGPLTGYVLVEIGGVCATGQPCGPSVTAHCSPSDGIVLPASATQFVDTNPWGGMPRAWVCAYNLAGGSTYTQFAIH